MSENQRDTVSSVEREAAPARFVLDAAQSTFTVHAFSTGLLAGFGHSPTIAIRDFAGDARFVPGTLADASLRIVIQAASLTVADDVKAKDRRDMEETMLGAVLDVRSYPEIVFQSTSITPTRVVGDRFKARIIGSLTLRGVTKGGIWILATLGVNGDDLRAQGDFTLKQSAYGIKPVSVAAGVLKLKDELKFAFDLVGHRAPDGA
jgi:polyisoprenoid-binding protein YceI